MKILFLTGPHAVGKSYFMQQLATTNNFFQFDTGPEMRRMHKESLSEKNIGEWKNKRKTPSNADKDIRRCWFH